MSCTHWKGLKSLPVSWADGVEDWEVSWMVCSSRSPISEPLRMLDLLVDWWAPVAANSPKKRTIDGMVLRQRAAAAAWRTSGCCPTPAAASSRCDGARDDHLPHTVYLSTCWTRGRKASADELFSPTWSWGQIGLAVSQPISRLDLHSRWRSSLTLLPSCKTLLLSILMVWLVVFWRRFVCDVTDTKTTLFRFVTSFGRPGARRMLR